MAEDVPFGELLRRMRIAADLTLDGLAAASGVSDRAISDMERGVSLRPRARTVEAIADGLGVTGADREALLTAARGARATTAATPAHQLPAPRQVTDFAGRDAELAQVREWTAGGGVVVISGDAGVGKTTFAVRAVRPTLFVDLRGLDAKPLSAAALLARLIRALDPGVRIIPRDIAEASTLWRTMIGGRPLVIVLDNASSEDQVRPALPPDGPAVVLVTSRRTLSGLDDVRRLRLEPLPETDAVTLLASILGPAAATDEELRRIAELCVNIPLALRIAGNRLAGRPGWTAGHLIARLAEQERRLDTLTAGDVRVRAAFDLSYQQLAGPARRLFRRLALVPGPSTGPELASVLVAEPVPVTEDALDDLADLSLLQQRPDGRFEFHDLLRLYADGELQREEDPAERAAAARRRDEWLLDTVIVAGRHFEPGFGPGRAGVAEVVALDSREEAEDWLRAEADNWLPALRAAAEAGRHERVVDVAESLHWFSDFWFSWTGWEDVFTLSVTATRHLGDDRLRAIHEGYLTWVYVIVQGRLAEGLSHARLAVEHAVRAGDRTQIGWARYYLAGAYERAGQSPEALREARAAVEDFRSVNEREGLPNALLQSARIAAGAGSLDGAAELYREVLTLVRDPATAPPPHIADFAEATAYGLLADLEEAAGRGPEAIEAATRQLEVRERLHKDPVALMPSLVFRARLHAKFGNSEAARADLNTVRETQSQAGAEVTWKADLQDRIDELERELAGRDDATEPRLRS
ncbi:helix-turn-helix domain-containing protein [Actinoplanes sp. Pm04-4]|uniref:Helix-turn-helix domain-containing protein n=1 Tax=Paractinoplanes pyxinae TaxID=2997416 RepID=A0ABT4AR84_9ACTN|nr:XRE family transcriptional regulator [Actinoplanes pyxinae]MCY1136758.1 helix-turn-helix domain-containing protein [Actinoplanes pyxinae]